MALEKLGVREDYLNSKRTRNSDNCDQLDYNCGGFATETYSWLCPYPLEHEITDDTWEADREQDRLDFIEELLDQGLTETEVANEVLEYDLNYFAGLFGDKFRLATYDEIRDKKEGLIAYRICSEEIAEENAEFHFRVRRGGHWWEKMGCGEIEDLGECVDNLLPWTYSYYIYDSNIAYFFIDK